MALIVTVSACKLLAYLTRKVRHTHYSVKLTGKGKQVAKKEANFRGNNWQQLRGGYN